MQPYPVLPATVKGMPYSDWIVNFGLIVSGGAHRPAMASSMLVIEAWFSERQCSNPRRKAMNWDQVNGKWKQYKGKAQEKWGKLTDDDIDVIDGKRQQLVGKIQERYGIAKEAAEEQVDEFVKSLQAVDREETRREGRVEGRQEEKVRRAGHR